MSPFLKTLPHTAFLAVAATWLKAFRSITVSPPGIGLRVDAQANAVNRLPTEFAGACCITCTASSDKSSAESPTVIDDIVAKSGAVPLGPDHNNRTCGRLFIVSSSEDASEALFDEAFFFFWGERVTNSFHTGAALADALDCMLTCQIFSFIKMMIKIGKQILLEVLNWSQFNANLREKKDQTATLDPIGFAKIQVTFDEILERGSRIFYESIQQDSRILCWWFDGAFELAINRECRLSRASFRGLRSWGSSPVPNPC